MKKYTLSALLVGTFISLSIVSAQVTGDVAPDQVNSGCTNLSYNLTYRKSKDSNTNGEVSDLQYFLQDQGLLTVEPNGNFGPSTFKAVQNFQRKYNLITSGYVGPITRAKIKELSCSGSTVSTNTGSQNTTGNTGNSGTQQVACTMEAVRCPNGTYVGRTGPNCEAKCPVSTSPNPAIDSVVFEKSSAGSGGIITIKGSKFDAFSNSVKIANKVIYAQSSNNGTIITIDSSRYGITTGSHIVSVVTVNGESNTYSFSFNDGFTQICNSEQYLENGICKNITRACPDGRVVTGFMSCDSFSAPTIIFNVSPTAPNLNTPLTLSWSSMNTRSCTSDWGSVIGTSGSETRRLTGKNPESFTVSCTGPGGSLSKTVSVNVSLPTTNTTTNINTNTNTNTNTATTNITSTNTGSNTNTTTNAGVSTNTTTTSVVPVCNSEQTLVNGVCTAITVAYTCPNGTVIQVGGTLSPESKASKCQAVFLNEVAGTYNITGGGFKSTAISKAAAITTCKSKFSTYMDSFTNGTSSGSLKCTWNMEEVYSVSPSITLSATPLSVVSGKTTTVTWSTKDLKSCKIVGLTGGTAYTDTTLTGSKVVGPLTAARKITLSCATDFDEGMNTTLYKSITISVTQPAVAPTQAIVNGVCGADHNATSAVAPTVNLCSAGSASSVSEPTINGEGSQYVWQWTCAGINGGTTASCFTNKLNFGASRDSENSLSHGEVKGKVLGASTACVTIARNMHRGAESTSVTTLQKFLQSKGLLTEVTGFYGDKTIEAVKDYQGSKGLPVTGMVYDATREAIKGETCQ